MEQASDVDERSVSTKFVVICHYETSRREEEFKTEMEAYRFQQSVWRESGDVLFTEVLCVTVVRLAYGTRE